MPSIEWQVFRDTENTEKSRKVRTKRKTWKIAENSVFETQNKKYPRKSLFSEYFNVKFMIKNLRLVKLLLKFNNSLSVNVVERSTLSISALSDILASEKRV